MSICPRLLTVQQLLILGLASWRASRIVTMEAGPFDLFGRLRKRLGAKYDPYTKRWYGTNGLATLVTCPACASVWIATAFTLGIRWLPLAWLGIEGLAGSAVAVLADQYQGRGHG